MAKQRAKKLIHRHPDPEKQLELSPKDLYVSGFSVQSQTCSSLAQCAASGGRTDSSFVGLISGREKKEAFLRTRNKTLQFTADLF